MKNLILIFLSSIALIAASKADESIYKNNLGSPNPKMFMIEKDSQKVDFIKVTKHNFNQKQVEKLNKDIPTMNKVLASKCFRVFMEGRDLIQTKGKTNSEVVKHIRSSKVGVELISYYSVKGTVGYTYPNVNKIWMNKRLHRNFNSCRSASNLAHEGTHKIGYGHDYKKTSRRRRSVPYSINAAFGACCGKDLEEDPKPEPKKKLICRRSWKTLWLKKTCYRR